MSKGRTKDLALREIIALNAEIRGKSVSETNYRNDVQRMVNTQQNHIATLEATIRELRQRLAEISPAPVKRSVAAEMNLREGMAKASGLLPDKEMD